MITFYLICFVLGFALSVLAAFAGLGRVHFGHFHVGHMHVHSYTGAHLSAVNGITFPAFLCWFGGAGYLLHRYSPLYGPLVLLFAVISGLLGGAILYVILFRFLIPHEQVLAPED